MQSLHYDGRMPSATAVAVVAPPAGVEDADCGLRERKKRETRAAIHRAALELAHEGGVDALTVDAIAERAGVSPRTFFNYFPTKDDAIIGSGASELDALATLVAVRPAGESVREIVHAIALIRMAALERDPESWAMRRELTLSEPAVGLRFLGVYARADRVLVDALVERARVAAAGALSADEEFAVAVEAHAALGAVRAAIRMHLAGAYAGAPLRELLDRAYALL